MQCSCNTLLAVCRAQFRKVSLWNSFDLDFVLNLRDNLFKSFGLHQFLDASDLPEHVSFHGNSWTRNKTYLHGAEAIICTRFFFSPFLPCSRNAASLFIKSTVTAIISYSRSYYLTHIVEIVEVSQLAVGHQFCSNFLVYNRLRITLKLFIQNIRVERERGNFSNCNS